MREPYLQLRKSAIKSHGKHAKSSSQPVSLSNMKRIISIWFKLSIRKLLLNHDSCSVGRRNAIVHTYALHLSLYIPKLGCMEHGTSLRRGNLHARVGYEFGYSRAEGTCNLRSSSKSYPPWRPRFTQDLLPRLGLSVDLHAPSCALLEVCRRSGQSWFSRLLSYHWPRIAACHDDWLQR